MKTLTVRQLPDEVHDALRVQAAANGRSMEEEVRRLIEANVEIRGKPDLEPLRRLRRRIAEKYSAEERHRMFGEFMEERRAEARREADEGGMMEKAKPWQGKETRTKAEKLAAVERLHNFVRSLWGGELPGDIVDTFLNEKYEETARENAKDGS